MLGLHLPKPFSKYEIACLVVNSDKGAAVLVLKSCVGYSPLQLFQPWNARVRTHGIAVHDWGQAYSYSYR